MRHFKVHWLGFADNDDTWEREEDLMESGYQELIDDYKVLLLPFFPSFSPPPIFSLFSSRLLTNCSEIS